MGRLIWSRDWAETNSPLLSPMHRMPPFLLHWQPGLLAALTVLLRLKAEKFTPAPVLGCARAEGRR